MTAKTCQTCLHRTCLFHGEERLPIYNGNSPKEINCWDNAEALLSKATQNETK